jgi:hypothetical protein
MAESRNLKLLATMYWAPYTCEAALYIQDDHPSGRRCLIARYGEGYSGPSDLPIVDGMREFVTAIPSDMTEEEIINQYIALDLSGPTNGQA